jgi:hypothetical protein
MIIPFGKFKGSDSEILYENSNLEYSKWLYENCQELLKKDPKFNKFLEERLEGIETELPEKLPYDDFNRTNRLDDMESNGIMINNFQEYKIFLCKLYNRNFIKSNNEELLHTFGKPLVYPFVITLRKNTMDEFNSVAIHKVYIKSRPSFYTFRQSYYE